MICRLCGDEKSAEELVISLLEPTNILTFKEFVEYYCQISLDPCPTLPQKVCKPCKVSIDRFAAFSCKVVQTQKTLSKNPASDPKQDATSEPSGAKLEEKTAVNGTEVKSTPTASAAIEQPTQSSPVLNATITAPPTSSKTSEEPRPQKAKKSQTTRSTSTSNALILPAIPITLPTSSKTTEAPSPQKSNKTQESTQSTATSSATISVPATCSKSSEEPSPKRPKLDESEEDLLQEISFHEQVPEEQKSKAIRQLEEIDRIFNPLSLDCEKIQIPDHELGPNGRVPREWLLRFEDFTSWEDFRYTCNHCNTKFDTLFSYAQHCVTLPASERLLKCNLCKSTSRGVSYLATYTNHMSREHYPHIKFCCIICSEVYCNMKNLSTHYQSQHFKENLSIFPCLDCGYYSHCISALRNHKKQHDPKP